MFTTQDVDQALNDAQSLALAGEYEKALERHVWYHNNALRYHPAHTGVRLSYALSDWKALGQKYQPATEAMKVARDEALASFRRDPEHPDHLTCAMSLNLALEDVGSTKTLFYESRALGLEAWPILHHLSFVTSTGDLPWIADVVGDPLVRIKDLTRRRDSMVMASTAMYEQKELVDGLDNGIRQQLTALLSAVRVTQGEEVANGYRAEVLRVFDSEIIRRALIDA